MLLCNIIYFYIISVERFPYQEKRLQLRVTGSTPWWLSAWWQKYCHKTTQTHTQREVPAYHAPCCKSRTQRRDHHAYRKTPFTCIQSVTGWQNADLNSRAWCLLNPESQLSTFPALELPSKRSTFTAYSFLQKAVNELLHRTRTYEEISLICQNIATILR